MQINIKSLINKNKEEKILDIKKHLEIIYNKRANEGNFENYVSLDFSILKNEKFIDSICFLVDHYYQSKNFKKQVSSGLTLDQIWKIFEDLKIILYDIMYLDNYYTIRYYFIEKSKYREIVINYIFENKIYIDF